MEEFEDLVPTPDDEGRLELTYRAWSTVDDVIWTMGRTLVFLDLSFNSITNIPDELGDLYQLKELNLACNQVVALPESIGKLNKLNELRANGNKITEVSNTHSHIHIHTYSLSPCSHSHSLLDPSSPRQVQAAQDNLPV